MALISPAFSRPEGVVYSRVTRTGRGGYCEVVQGFGSHLRLSQTKKRVLLRGESGGGTSSEQRDGRFYAPRGWRVGPGAGPPQGRGWRDRLPLLAAIVAGRAHRPRR